MTADQIDALASELFNLLLERGGAAYCGEQVTQLEHALQTAALAEAAGADDSLVVAALLHDVGHLLGPAADQSIDARHEDRGHQWLADRFGAAVTDPVALHVAAKRYLCAVEPGYAASLSQASIDSLALQGGPMRDDEGHAFAREPAAGDAAALRRWDDAAKVKGLDVPGLPHYEGRLRRLLERP